MMLLNDVMLKGLYALQTIRQNSQGAFVEGRQICF